MLKPVYNELISLIFWFTPSTADFVVLKKLIVSLQTQFTQLIQIAVHSFLHPQSFSLILTAAMVVVHILMTVNRVIGLLNAQREDDLKKSL